MAYKESSTDILTVADLVTKSYLIDAYPGLIDSAKMSGLWLWGSNNYGRLGNNSTTNVSSPIQTVSGGMNWKSLMDGGYASHSAAIKTDGTLWLWGNNGNGKLGTNNTTATSSPVQTAAAGTNWKQVAGGSDHTLAIKTDNSLWAWGGNSSGQLGDGSTTARSSPVPIGVAGTSWKQVSCNISLTAVVKNDGTLWLWGINTFGALGDNSVIPKSSPVQTVAGGTNWKQVGVGNGFSAAVKTDGTLWVWGYNGWGQVGDNSITNRSSPIQTVAGGTNWKLVNCGIDHIAAIKTDGTLWMWGRGGNGRLGDNTAVTKSSPVQTVAGGTNWRQVSCGGEHTAAIKTDGTLWLWGASTEGQIGGNNTTTRSSPVQTVAAGTNWKQVSALSFHTLTIKDFDEDF